jgi:hypothetical protein
MARNRDQKLAFVISRIFGPLPLICLLWLTVAVKSGIGFWRAIWVYPVIFLISIALPFSLTTYLIAKKKVSDIEWSNIKQRRQYLPFITIFGSVSLAVLTYFLTDQTIFHLGLVLILIINLTVAIWSVFNFKISAHATLATCTFLAINLFFHLKFLWLFILLIPIIWARKTLKMHSMAQLVAGIILPMVISLMALLLFGWPNI